MAYANILSSLKTNETLSGLVLYGKIRCAIKQPEMLGGLQVEPGCKFAILDVFSVKCTDKDYFGSNLGMLYHARGSMIICINDVNLIGEVVKVGGTSLKYGVKVKQQYGRKTEYDGVIALVFKYSNNGYIICPNYITKLAPTDSDISQTPFVDFVLKLNSNQAIEYPVTLDSIMPFEGCVEYEEEESKSNIINQSIFSSNADEKIDVTKINLNLEYHLKGKNFSPLIEDVRADILDMHTKRVKYAMDLRADLSEKKRKGDDEFYESMNKIKSAFVKNIGNNYYNNIGNSYIKGSVYGEDFITKCVMTTPFNASSDYTQPNQADLNNSLEIIKTLVAADTSLLGTLIDGCESPMLKTPTNTLLVIFSVSLGIPLEDLNSNYISCANSSDLPFELWVYTLLYMPYHVGIMGSSLSVVDCDKIYFGYTKNFVKNGYNQECLNMRNNLLYLKTLEDLDDKNSFISRYDLSVAEACYPGKGNMFLTKNNFPMKQDLVELMCVICNKDIRLSKQEISALSKVQWYSEERTNNLIESGIINSVEDDKEYLVLEKDVEKEFLIYETLLKKGNSRTEVTDEIIKEALDEFESEKGFKLEKLQRDGIQLCKFKAAVLSGCAGSGKTTVSDCLTNALKKGMPKSQIIYGTPTGKACRRLAEVVGGSVKTLHSQFGVGLSGEGYLTDIKKKYQDYNNPSKNIYILDEMAMCNRDLLYQVCRSLSEEDMVYFLGDCKQLPPIGAGNPFYVLMKLLPCVELGVSKRAAEGSNINYNTTLVNCMSDDVVQELYYDDYSFMCEECVDADIPTVVSKIWKGFMDGSYCGKSFSEDDIQIISGYATPKKTFSSTNLNPPIQSYLRRGDKLLFKSNERLFYKNDRVIHVNLNSYGAQRYIEVEQNVFKSVISLGIVNGEVGKILGVTRGDFVRFIDFDVQDIEIEKAIYGNLSKEEIENLLSIRESREDKIREDSSFCNSKYYFVKVQVYDTDLKRDIVVLYPAKSYKQDEDLILGGEDLNNLELAYALTTHKMQGSQSKVVILPFGTTCSPQFINRNMINTMITRSQEVVVMVGTVKGKDSPVNKGRKYKSEVKCKDFLNWICSTN